MNNIHIKNKLTTNQKRKAILFGVKRTIFTKPIRVLFVLMFALLSFQFFTNLVQYFEEYGQNLETVTLFLNDHFFIAIALVFFFTFPPIFSTIAAQLKWRKYEKKQHADVVIFSKSKVQFFYQHQLIEELSWSAIEMVLCHQDVYLLLKRQQHDIIPVSVDSKKADTVKTFLHQISSDLYKDGIKLEVFN